MEVSDGTSPCQYVLSVIYTRTFSVCTIQEVKLTIVEIVSGRKPENIQLFYGSLAAFITLKTVLLMI